VKSGVVRMMKGKNLATILVLTVLLSMLCGCVDYEVETQVSTPTPAPTLRPTLQPTPTPLVTEKEKNVETVTDIVEEYYKTHTYSVNDLFVCADMAIDVWNMVETQGINAEIAVGNVDDPNADWTEYNHAWVLAEVSPDTWLAIETTGGYVTYDENYYRGYFFDNPKEFKKYLELAKEYTTQIDRINGLNIEYSNCYNEYITEYNDYIDLLNEFNSKYAGHPVSAEGLSFKTEMETQLAIAKEKEGQCNQLSKMIEAENVRLLEIVNQMEGLLA